LIFFTVSNTNTTNRPTATAAATITTTTTTSQENGDLERSKLRVHTVWRDRSSQTARSRIWNTSTGTCTAR